MVSIILKLTVFSVFMVCFYLVSDILGLSKQLTYSEVHGPLGIGG